MPIALTRDAWDWRCAGHRMVHSWGCHIMAPHARSHMFHPTYQDSVDTVQQLLDAEIASGTSPCAIVLGGFSQGGALAAHVALRTPNPLAGLLVVNGYLPGLHRTPLLVRVFHASSSSNGYHCHTVADNMVNAGQSPSRGAHAVSAWLQRRSCAHRGRMAGLSGVKNVLPFKAQCTWTPLMPPGAVHGQHEPRHGQRRHAQPSAAVDLRPRESAAAGLGRPGAGRQRR